MAFNEQLTQKVREYLVLLPELNVEEKNMMGGLTFMVNGKMCVGIVKDDLMVRFDPSMHDDMLKKNGCREMDMMKRTTRGFVFVDQTGTKPAQDFKFWLELALDYNAKIKPKK